MAVHPTRFLNKASPLDMLTLDQLLMIHGPNPNPKRIPQRPIGPPKTRDELRGDQDGRRLYGARPIEATVTTAAPPVTSVTSNAPVPYTPIPPSQNSTPRTSTKPKARLKPMLVSPTDPEYRGAWTPQPCRQLVVIEIDVEDVGIIEYPVACETVGAHVGQPHMARIRGVNPATDRPYADVFVGWYEDGPPTYEDRV